MAGKGDKQRPTDFKKYRSNYDKIFKKDVDIEEEWDQKKASYDFVKQLEIYTNMLGI